MAAELAIERPHVARRPRRSNGLSGLSAGARGHGAQLERAIVQARFWGPLRRVEPHQAPVIQRATEIDKTLLPRWQRDGDGHHAAAPAAAYRGIRPWRSRDFWLTAVVPAALASPEGTEALSRHRVAPEAFALWAREISKFAMHDSGRRTIVRPDRLAELMGRSESTVHRCRRVAADLGLYVVVVPGRMLYEAEKNWCREHGSRQRGLSNEVALTIPDLVFYKIAAPKPRGKNNRDTPPRGSLKYPFKLTHPGSFRLEPRSAGRTEPTPSARHQKRKRSAAASGPRPRARKALWDPLTLAVARELVDLVPWLHGTAPGRLERGLRRFVHAPGSWTAGDVVTAMNQLDQRLSRASMTRDRVKNAPALLASYLRTFDPQADHPLGPDYVDDPAKPRIRGVSAVQKANQQRLAAARLRANAPSDEARQAYVEQIRAELLARRSHSPADNDHRKDQS